MNFAKELLQRWYVSHVTNQSSFLFVTVFFFLIFNYLFFPLSFLSSFFYKKYIFCFSLFNSQQELDGTMILEKWLCCNNEYRTVQCFKEKSPSFITTNLIQTQTDLVRSFNNDLLFQWLSLVYFANLDWFRKEKINQSFFWWYNKTCSYTKFSKTFN